jgi:hypothetical protein
LRGLGRTGGLEIVWLFAKMVSSGGLWALGFGLWALGLVLKFFLDLTAKKLVSWCFGLGLGLDLGFGLAGFGAGLRLSGCLPKWLAVAGFGLWALDLTVTAKKLVSLGFLGLGGAWAGLGRGWTWA